MPSHIRSFRDLMGRFRRNRGGASAIEFALIAPFFIGLLFAIIETGFMFFASQVLETVTQDSARQIFTGQVQGQALTATQFKTLVCSKVVALFDCANGISIDVQNYPQFSNVDVSSAIDPSRKFTNPNNYSPGGPGDIVVVRLFYQWPIIVTTFGYDLSSLANGKRLLTATAAFQNEPYGN
jgi:Flp pilus assembly protein TadG